MFAWVAFGQRWRISGARHHLGALAVIVGNRRALGLIGDDHERPVLSIGTGWRLHRDLDAFLNELWLNRPGEVESLAYGTSGGEQFVGGSAVDSHVCTLIELVGYSRPARSHSRDGAIDKEFFALDVGDVEHVRYRHLGSIGTGLSGIG
ncbi:unannotated protein [freshwater metagenome]|uniref:Unannotated protein n=1 Tax=freshwater metagenome TaxID=449393 RepID=A0A6J6PNL4_9ZZZZ